MTPFSLSAYLPWCLQVGNDIWIVFLLHVRSLQVINLQKPQTQYFSSSRRWKWPFWFIITCAYMFYINIYMVYIYIYFHLIYVCMCVCACVCVCVCMPDLAWGKKKKNNFNLVQLVSNNVINVTSRSITWYRWKRNCFHRYFSFDAVYPGVFLLPASCQMCMSRLSICQLICFYSSFYDMKWLLQCMSHFNKDWGKVVMSNYAILFIGLSSFW